MSISRRFIATATAATSLILSNQALAGLAPTGTIIFNALDTGTPFVPVPVPTLGILAAVMLIGGLAVVALHALRKNQQTFASLAGLGAVLGVALSVGSIGALKASGGTIEVKAEDLEQQLQFNCGFASFIETKFQNATSSPIFVSEINIDNTCAINPADTTCELSDGSKAIQPGDSCTIAAGSNIS